MKNILQFRKGNTARSIITDGEYMGDCGSSMTREEITEAYGGRLVCESIDPEFQALLEAAPDLHRALAMFINVLPGEPDPRRWTHWAKDLAAAQLILTIGMAKRALEKAGPIVC